MAQLGRALRSGRRGRVFESRRADLKKAWNKLYFKRLSGIPRVFFVVSFGVRLCPVPPKFHQNLEPVSLFHNGNLNTSYKILVLAGGMEHGEQPSKSMWIHKVLFAQCILK